MNSFMTEIPIMQKPVHLCHERVKLWNNHINKVTYLNFPLKVLLCGFHEKKQIFVWNVPFDIKFICTIYAACFLDNVWNNISMHI